MVSARFPLLSPDIAATVDAANHLDRWIACDFSATVSELVMALSMRYQERGTFPPAALVGSWFEVRAVIAPEIHLVPVDPKHAFAEHPLTARIGAEEADAPETDSDPPGHTDLPAWTFGYLGYPDELQSSPRQLPEAVSGRTSALLVLDTHDRWYRCGPGIDDAEIRHWLAAASAAAAAAEATGAGTGTGPEYGTHGITWEFPDDADNADNADDAGAGADGAKFANQDHHRDATQRALEAIAEGEIYQACISTRLRGHHVGCAVTTFARMLEGTTAERSAMLIGTWGSVLSFSPEVFLLRHANSVTSSPIKGTAPISSDPEDLRRSDKDIAENVMIVDMVRNDLGRVATSGSVVVTDLLSIQQAPGVWQLVSTVTASTEAHNAELLAATFPPASVTGTPKQRARSYITEWENHSRGVHCGAIGAATTGHLELSVAIRTIEIDPSGAAQYGVGGGITADSQTSAEWEECLDKAAFLRPNSVTSD